MEETKRSAKDKGYVETIFGRKAHYPQIKSSNPSERAFMERAAINAPIQGSAADIIKVAMLDVEKALSDAGMASRMLLQVHDELVFEVGQGERVALEQLVLQQLAAATQGLGLLAAV
jgi:DNA polymerase-1